MPGVREYMNRFAGIFLTAMTLAACATSPDHKVQLDTWIGKSTDDLIHVWGPSSKEYPQSGGGKILEYSKSERLSYGGETVTKTQTTYTEHGLSSIDANAGPMLASSHASSSDQIAHTVEP